MHERGTDTASETNEAKSFMTSLLKEILEHQKTTSLDLSNANRKSSNRSVRIWFITKLVFTDSKQ